MPPVVQIRIDQLVLITPGIPGQAREDIVLGSPIILTAVGGPFRAYRWSFIDKALDFESNVVSSAAIALPTQAVTSVAPIDVEGTYLVQLEVDSGAGLGASANDVARITFYASPSTAPLALQAHELPQRVPSVNETTEHNVPNTADPTGNKRGWAYAVGRWFKGVLRRLYRVGGRAGARVSTSSAGPTVTEIRKVLVESVTFDGTKYTVNLTPALPGGAFHDMNYGVSVTPHESVDYGHPFTWAVTIIDTSTFEVAFYDITDAPTGADFTVLAVLGDEPT